LEENIIENKVTPLQIKSLSMHTSRVISVCSGKGGVGKTFLSVNLGIALAKLGKKVLIFDADLGLGNINLLLGFIPKFTIFHVLKGHRSLRDIVFHTVYGVDVIPGASGYAGIANLDSAQRQTLVQGFSELQDYDFIILDVGAGIGFSVVSFALASDEVILVINPEPTSITDGYGFIKSIVANDKAKKISLVINKIRTSDEGHKVIKRIGEISEKFLSFKLNSLGFIPFDIDVENSIKKQKPILFLAPNSKPAENIMVIARKILGEKVNSKSLGTGVVNFFKKRFSILEDKKPEQEQDSAS
jgi:flagellar biosynthesis protein FlhG